MTLFLEINELLGDKLITLDPFNSGRACGLFAQEETSIWGTGLPLLFLLAQPEPAPQSRDLQSTLSAGMESHKMYHPKGEPTSQ